jgi:hypothetical protein
LIDVLYQTFPIVEGNGFFYEREGVLDTVWKGVFEAMTERAITPIDLTRQRIKLDQEVRELLIRAHPEAVEFCLSGCFGIRIPEHIAEFLDEARPVLQPVGRSIVGVLFVFELRVEVTLGSPAQIG